MEPFTFDLEVFDLSMSSPHQYFSFTLPELEESDRVRLHIRLAVEWPLVFYVLNNDETQLQRLKNLLEDKMGKESREDMRKLEVPGFGFVPYHRNSRLCGGLRAAVQPNREVDLF